MEKNNNVKEFLICSVIFVFNIQLVIVRAFVQRTKGSVFLLAEIFWK